MRSLNRNKRPLYYATYIEDQPILDKNGYETGEYSPVYSEPEELRCNVSAASGEDAVEAFGSLTGYSRTISVSDLACPLDEKCVVWFGISPDEPYNYVVTRKADSKNAIMYALQEVTVRT